MNQDESKSSEKKVDESWKEQVKRDKEARAVSPGQEKTPGVAHERGLPQADFNTFLSTFSIQALIALGEVPHPATHQLEEDLEQARYIIDSLGLLQEKTKGNLTQEESSFLEGILYELRIKYASKAKR